MKRIDRFLSAILVALAIGLALSAVRAAEKGLPEGARALRDLQYIPGGHERQKLDLYLPAEQPAAKGGKLPLVIWVHGGAWLGGSKDQCPALRFLREGYAVASVNYRLSRHAIFPAQIEDVKAAVRWLRAHAREHGIDPDRFGAWGASAGGHLVALLGTSGDVKEFEKGPHLDVSSRVQAVCDFFGPTDLPRMSAFPSTMNHDAPDSPESLLVGGPIQERKELAAKANPIAYVTADDPPFLILHGDKDPLVPLNQSEILREALVKAKVDVTFQVIEGKGHGFGGQEIDRQVTEFFAKNLKGAPAKEAQPGAVLEKVYKKTPQGELRIFIHLPPGWKAEDRRPAIVFFFGGAWLRGTPEQFRPQAEYLATRGMVAARADYRVRSRHGTGPAACVEDAKSAMRWLRAHAAETGVDPERIVAAGGSAGGHIAACTALVGGFDAEGEDIRVSSRPSALVLFNPVLDLRPFGRGDPGGDEADATRAAISPIAGLTKGAPPAQMFFGTKDLLLAQGRAFLDASAKLGNRAELHTAEGQGHAFFNRAPWMKITLRKADEFLASLGYLEGAPTVDVPSEPRLATEPAKTQ